MNIKLFGDKALLVEFEQVVSEQVNSRVHALQQFIEQQSVTGVEYFIPAYCSLTIGFDPEKTAINPLKSLIESFVSQPSTTSSTTFQVPVCYSEEFGIDMQDICRETNLSRSEVIAAHCSKSYTVFMLGFLAGFAYLGSLPESLKCSRLKRPRPHVPRGAVAIAEQQTGIYPMVSPGGWRIVGQTPIDLIHDDPARPFLLNCGDKVQFVPIDNNAFNDLRSQVVARQFDIKTWYDNV